MNAHSKPRALSLRPLAALVPTLLALTLSACGGGGSGGGDTHPPPSADRQVSLEFSAQAGQTPVGCGTPIAALGSGAVQAELNDLRFYVSELALVKADGTAETVQLAANEWQLPESGVALIDLEDGTGACADRGTAATNAAITGTVPAGNYTGLRMTLGVPSSHNHTDTAAAPAPLDIQAMAWSWQAGRKFVKIEVAPVGGVYRPANPDVTPPITEGQSPRWNLHLGSTGCTGNPVSGETVSCAAPNRVVLHFDNFNVDTQRLVLDLQTLLLSSNLSIDLGGPYGCMSGKTDPECPAVFETMALDMESGLTVDRGRNQRIFRIEAR